MIAVIPVAGLGTRMLPASKAIPKEMLPILDKPIIQWVVEEAANAGVSKIVLITRFGKEAIENHFDTNFEIEHNLNSAGKQQLLHKVKNTIPTDISIISVRQPISKGLGDAILYAKSVVNKEPIAILLPDILLLNKKSNDLKTMINRFEATGRSQILVTAVPREKVKDYGIVSCETNDIAVGEFANINGLVEKPRPTETDSRLSIVGRYILNNNIFKYLKETPAGVGGEIQLTDAIIDLINDGSGADAFRMTSKTFDCGNKTGFIQANIAAAIEDDTTFAATKEFIDSLNL